MLNTARTRPHYLATVNKGFVSAPDISYRRNNIHTNTHKHTNKSINSAQSWKLPDTNIALTVNSFDNHRYPMNTGDWAITNDNYGRIEQAIGHGIKTTHDHDDFGNNIKHHATASPTPPSSTPPSTMINWEFSALPGN
jgi:hypothetical protein